MLKAIGFWIESLKDEVRPAPQEIGGTLSIDIRAALAQYLVGGYTYATYRGYSWCRFNCGIENAQMGKSALSDGIWLWPEGLAHYVSKHGIVLPEEFISHAQSGSARRQPDRTEEVDLDFWSQWCQSRRSPNFLKRLRTARDAAELRVQAMRAERIVSLERNRGTSDVPCAWSGCSQKSLAGMRVCAEHSLQPIDESVFDIPYFTGLKEYLQSFSAVDGV